MVHCCCFLVNQAQRGNKGTNKTLISMIDVILQISYNVVRKYENKTQ